MLGRIAEGWTVPPLGLSLQIPRHWSGADSGMKEGMRRKSNQSEA